MFYNILLNWFSSDCLQDEDYIVQLCRISIKLWPWTGTNKKMQLVFMKTFTFVCEDSIPGQLHPIIILCKILKLKLYYSLQGHGHISPNARQ